MAPNRRQFLHLSLSCGGYTLATGKLLASPAADPASYQMAAARIRSLFEKKKPPGPGDWLANHPESGQTFAQYPIHESGHMFGIGHCIAYECCMNGSNSLAESDRTPLVFCPECDAKLWWACNLDPLARAKALANFAQRHALQAEAKQWSRIVGLLE